MKESKRVLLHLSLIHGVGPAVIHAVITSLDEQELTQLYSYSESDIMTRLHMSPKRAHTLVQGLRDTTLLERELELLSKHSDIQWISLYDQEYPELLRQIYMPPVGLYVRGALDALHTTSLAVVGARKADQYGKRVVDVFVPQLVRYGYTIVSGGALGLDTMAHRAAVRVRGVTVSVLGSGLLRPYPSSNKALFEEIVSAGGAVISSFPLQMDGFAGNFPARNRIIAGMSSGCIVVQAAARSGARITAQFALEQGKDVFAVPGQWDHPLSQGCHELIAEGATIALSPDVICSGPEVKQDQQQPLFESDADQEPDVASMNRHQAIVYLCKTPLSVDELAVQLKAPIVEIQSELFNLQIEGQIAQNFAGLWQSL